VAFHIKNRETDALVRRVAKMRGVGLTQAIHDALEHALAEEAKRPQLSDQAVRFCRELRARSDGTHERPADSAFFETLSDI